MRGLIDTASRWVCHVTEAVCIVIIYAMLGLLTTQVVARYFFGAPPSWTEEVAIILFAWVVVLYASVGVRQKFHVALDLVGSAGKGFVAVSDRIVAGAIFGVGALMLWAGMGYVLRTAGQRTAAMQMPIEVLHAVVPVGGALIMLHAAALLIDPVDRGEAA